MMPFLPRTTVRSQLAEFLEIPPDWNAENHGDTVVLIGPGGLTATLPNRKSEFTRDQWREAAAGAILELVPAERKNGTVPLAEFLSLPMGWKASCFIQTIEMRGQGGERCSIELPRQPTPRSILCQQAHDAISATLEKPCKPI